MGSIGREKILSSLLWRFLERIGAQGVSFIVSLVLARMLAPEAYGTIALVTVFIAILQVFVDSGLGNALIQKKDADDVDFSSVFYFNICICSALYLVLFLCAPLIGIFYNDNTLVPIVRVLGITLIISGLKNVQQAYVSKTLQFKKFFYSTLIGTVGSAVVGIIMAYFDFGVWALVFQNLLNGVIDTLILWGTVRWRPKRVFSIERLLVLVNFGWKILASSLLHTVYTNLRSLIIGKMYTTADLAYYNKGRSFPVLVVSNINTSIDSVLFPAMSNYQDSIAKVKALTRRSIMVSSYIMWPMMIGLAVVAEPLIVLLLTDKWLPAVPFLQIVCFSFALEPLQTANLNAIRSLGRSDITLKLEIIKKTISIGILILSMKYGVIAIALSGVVYAVIATVLNAFPNKNLLHYGYFEQLRDIMPSLIMAVVMGIIIYPIASLPIHLCFILGLQIIIGSAVYLLLSIIFKVEPYLYIIDIIKNFRRKV